MTTKSFGPERRKHSHTRARHTRGHLGSVALALRGLVGVRATIAFGCPVIARVTTCYRRPQSRDWTRACEARLAFFLFADLSMRLRAPPRSSVFGTSPEQCSGLGETFLEAALRAVCRQRANCYVDEGILSPMGSRCARPWAFMVAKVFNARR